MPALKNNILTVSGTTIEDLISDLTDQDPPQGWINFLFDIQNHLIASGYTESLTEKGAKELADRFAGLKGFFTELQPA